MATNYAQRSGYAPSFRELYHSERIAVAVSPDELVTELQEMAVARPFEAVLTEKLRYGEHRGEAWNPREAEGPRRAVSRRRAGPNPP